MPPPLHGAPAPPQRHRPAAHAHAQIRDPGGLLAPMESHRRPDAVRHVPRLHSGRTHPSPAPEHPPFPQPGQPPDTPALPRGVHPAAQTRAAQHRRPVPRHRQGTAGGSLRTRRRGCPGVLSVARAGSLREPAGRLAGAPSPADVGDRPAPRHLRPGRGNRLCPEGARRVAPRSALLPDRGRHLRHQRHPVERLEGHPAQGALFRHPESPAPGAGEPAGHAPQDPREPAPGPADPGPARGASGSGQHSLERLQGRLLPAPQPGADRLALPQDHRPWRQSGPSGAHRQAPHPRRQRGVHLLPRHAQPLCHRGLGAGSEEPQHP